MIVCILDQLRMDNSCKSKGLLATRDEGEGEGLKYGDTLVSNESVEDCSDDGSSPDLRQWLLTGL